MAQIAEATGIAAEDVARTIGTKDAIVLNVAGAMLTDVVKALADVDPQTPVVEALLAAHSSVRQAVSNASVSASFSSSTVTKSPLLLSQVLPSGNGKLGQAPSVLCANVIQSLISGESSVMPATFSRCRAVYSR
jgi:hypothetical protein